MERELVTPALTSLVARGSDGSQGNRLSAQGPRMIDPSEIDRVRVPTISMLWVTVNIWLLMRLESSL